MLRLILSTILILSIGGCEVTTPTTLEKESTIVVPTPNPNPNPTPTPTPNPDLTLIPTKQNIPTLVVIVNWLDRKESDMSVWSNFIFNRDQSVVTQQDKNSIANWYDKTTNGEIYLTPVKENHGTKNDGVVTVNMNIKHPNSSDVGTFKDTHLLKAIKSDVIRDSVDFAELDLDNDGTINRKELQILFIIAGDEGSTTSGTDQGIWAHAWGYDDNHPTIDGKKVLKYDDNPDKAGWYALIGATSRRHISSIGILAHEIGHSLLDLVDYYDGYRGSGLGWYDIMSDGAHSYKTEAEHYGSTPTQLSAFNKIASLQTSVKSFSSLGGDVTISCSSNEFIKLETKHAHEYFLVECRDLSKNLSDGGIKGANPDKFHLNMMFTAVYHVDETKYSIDEYVNTQSGEQTESHHYMIAVVEKETSTMMTSTSGIKIDYDDLYFVGDAIPSQKLKLYDGSHTGFTISVTDKDNTKRTMTINITKG